MPASASFAADYQHVRDFLKLRVADFRLHFFVAVVEFHANTGRKQFLHYFRRVCVLAFCDGQDGDLHRSEPRGKRSAVELDQIGSHTLHRAHHAAMDHHRAVLVSIRAYVAEVKLIRQMEIDLNGRIRFLMAHHVRELDIQLRPVKSRFAGSLALR